MLGKCEKHLSFFILTANSTPWTILTRQIKSDLGDHIWHQRELVSVHNYVLENYSKPP